MVMEEGENDEVKPPGPGEIVYPVLSPTPTPQARGKVSPAPGWDPHAHHITSIACP